MSIKSAAVFYMRVCVCVVAPRRDFYVLGAEIFFSFSCALLLSLTTIFRERYGCEGF